MCSASAGGALMRRLDRGNRSDTVFLLPGARYGKWTVLQDAAVRSSGHGESLKSRVRCDCGKTALRVNSALRSGQSRACQYCAHAGTARKPLSPGDRFGRWTILSDVGVRGNNFQTYSLARCDCGRTRTVNNGSLRAGASRSCRICSRGSRPDFSTLKAQAEAKRG